MNPLTDEEIKQLVASTKVIYDCFRIRRFVSAQIFANLHKFDFFTQVRLICCLHKDKTVSQTWRSSERYSAWLVLNMHPLTRADINDCNLKISKYPLERDL